jgi:hypothetical protein
LMVTPAVVLGVVPVAEATGFNSVAIESAMTTP